MFISQPENYGCPIPCTSHTFNPMLNTFHNYEFENENPHHIDLYAYYSSPTVEKKEEYFLYDTMTLASSLGGTVGLLLGYSLLSILLFLINSLESYLTDAYLARK